MALPGSGPISLNQVNTELQRPATQSINMNDTNVRSLAGIPSGAISMSNLRGKAWWVYAAGRTLLGDTGLSGGYPASTSFEWTPPANNRIITLYCEAYVYQHTGGQEYAYTYAEIQGWNGSTWVQLAQSGQVGTWTQGQTVYAGVGYSFNPYNSIYPKFRFVTWGNGFRRGVAGYKDAWYYQ